MLGSRPPNSVLAMVDSLCTKRNRELHHRDTDEEMVRRIQQIIEGLGHR